MELLDIRDLTGNLTGQIKERKEIHREGYIHGTSHVFITRMKDGICEVLLQKRAEDKDSFPGCYDISSAGHIPAGQDYVESALRELEEELGLIADANDLIFLGLHEGYSKEIFYGEPFINHEVSKVFLYTKEVDESSLRLQKEEISSVKWFDLEECIAAVRNHDKNFCLFEKELKMIKAYYSSSDEN